jgi:hypothetical protein
MKPEHRNRPKSLHNHLPTEFFNTLIKVFDPNAYEELSKRTFRKATAYIFSVLFISTVLMVICSTPKIAHVNDVLEQQLSKIQDFSISLNVSMSEPIVLKRPAITMDLNTNITPQKEQLLITKHYIYLRYPFCIIDWGESCYHVLNLDEYTNLADRTNELASLFTAIFIYMLPMVLLTILAVQLITYALWALAFTLVGIILLKVINRRLLARRIAKIAIYTLTPMVIIQTINNAFGCNLYGIPLMISSFYFIVATLIASEQGFRT